MKTWKKIVNFRNLFRIFSIIGVVMFFVPTFCVSCANENVDVTAFNCAKGFTYSSPTYTGPARLEDVPVYPLAWLIAVVPLLIFGLLFIKKIKSHWIGLITCILSAGMVFLWYYFKVYTAYIAAEEAYGTFTVYGTFYIPLCLYGIWFGLSLFTFIPIIKLDWSDTPKVKKKRVKKVKSLQETKRPSISQNEFVRTQMSLNDKE